MLWILAFLTLLWIVGVQYHRYKHFKSPFWKTRLFWTVEGLMIAIYLLIWFSRNAE
jgi:hypothetical protein